MATIEDARRKLPLRVMIQQDGIAPGKKMDCPFCGRAGRGHGGMFMGKSGQELFKCQRSKCPSGGKVLDEVGYLGMRANLGTQGSPGNPSPAFVAYMKQAGCWEEPRHAPSILPGSKKRRVKWPEQVAAAAEIGDGRSGIGDREDGAADESAGPEDNLPGETCGVPTGEPGEAEEAGAGRDIQQSQSGPNEDDANGNQPAPAAATVIQEKEDGRSKMVDRRSGIGDRRSGVGDGGEPPGAAEGDANWMPGQRALHAFWERITLSDEDLQGLWRKRGLIPEICHGAGLKSSLRSNERVLVEMAQEFSMGELVDAGLYRINYQGEAVPNRQYFGWSNTGRKDMRGEPERDWVHPVLIPYFNADGRVAGLRPHKDFVAGKEPLLYVVRGPGLVVPDKVEHLVVCEGEFKALAVVQVLRDRRHRVSGDVFAWAVAAPGITQTKRSGGGWFVREMLEEVLESARPEVVVVGFDHEEKGDKNLPGYKEDERDRYETQVWARYLAAEISKLSWPAKICLLPREWMDSGKADWDGALAKLAGSGKGGDPAAGWKQAARSVGRAFARAIEEARDLRETEQMMLWGWQAENIIKTKLEAFLYEPKLPCGGKREQEYARKLSRIIGRERKRGEASRVPDRLLNHLVAVAERYRETSKQFRRYSKRRDEVYWASVGRYYILQAPTHDQGWNESKGFKNCHECWESYRAAYAGDLHLRWAVSLAMKGMPQCISNFYIEPVFIMEKVNRKIVRMVKIHNIHGETWGQDELLELGAAHGSSPKPLREWLGDLVNVSFEGRETHLQWLTTDMCNELAYKTVKEVPCMVYYARARAWFFEDAAWDDDGQPLWRDKNGAFRTREGLWLSRDRDAEGEPFGQRRPAMHPLEDARKHWGGKTETEAVGNLFRELGTRLSETVGDECGWLLVGHIAAAVAMEEMFRRFNCFPGIWLPGESGQGKTTVARWLMRCLGYAVEKGIGVNSTAAGVGKMLGQQGSTFLWLDEFQPETHGEVVALMKMAFDRVEKVKMTFGMPAREMRCALMVTGVATSPDPQLTNRYFYVPISSARRTGNHYDFLRDKSPHFYFLTRWLIQNRRRFTELLMANMDEWLGSVDLAALPGDRDRVMKTNGLGFCAMKAIAEMTGWSTREEIAVLGRARRRAVQQVVSICGRVASQVTVNQVLRWILDAFQAGAFGHRRDDWAGYFKAVKTERPCAPGMEEWADLWPHDNPQGPVPWWSWRLYFVPGAVISVLNRWLVGQRLPAIVNVEDVRSQMSNRAWWLGNDCRQRFAGRHMRCWGVDVDLCEEYGLKLPSEREMQAAKVKADGTLWGRTEVVDGVWPDPRKGDLHALVEALEGLPGARQQEAFEGN